MKPVLVDSCNNYDGRNNECIKCGRSLPDVCLEFEQMKHKAEAYDALDNEADSPAPSAPIDVPVSKVKPRGRPRAKNPTD